MIPITRNIKDCDTWHRSPIADEQDGPVASMAVMRRNLVGRCNAFKSNPSRHVILLTISRMAFSIQSERFAMALRQVTVMDHWWLDRMSLTPLFITSIVSLTLLHRIQSAIERFFDQWLAEWGLMIGLGPGKLTRSLEKSKKCPPTYFWNRRASPASICRYSGRSYSPLNVRTHHQSPNSSRRGSHLLPNGRVVSCS